MHPDIPLARWASRQLEELARLAGAPAIARLSGAALLGERAAFNGFRVPYRQSAGGASYLLEARDGWVALSLPREDDRELLPALFMAEPTAIASDSAIALHVRMASAAQLVARGRELGMAIAAVEEADPLPPPHEMLATGQPIQRQAASRPLVIDLSGLWAGPLAGHLLWLAGAQVIKVESRNRPDAMRMGDPEHFAVLNQGKANVAIDLANPQDRDALARLIARADIVIESSRPRALQQAGIFAEALMRQRPGLVWLSITGHGARGQAANWIGFGDDCGVAGGLTAMLAHTTGVVGFVGDAIADPLTGIASALAAWRLFAAGQSRRIGMAMSGVVAQAIAEEEAFDQAQLGLELFQWAGAAGHAFARREPRKVSAPVRTLGADSSEWLSQRPVT